MNLEHLKKTCTVKEGSIKVRNNRKRQVQKHSGVGFKDLEKND